MNRNLPEDLAAKMSIALQMQQAGVSQRSVFEYIPMIKNADDEMDEVKQEKEDNIETFMGPQNPLMQHNNQNVEENNGDKTEL